MQFCVLVQLTAPTSGLVCHEAIVDMTPTFVEQLLRRYTMHVGVSAYEKTLHSFTFNEPRGADHKGSQIRFVHGPEPLELGSISAQLHAVGREPWKAEFLGARAVPPGAQLLYEAWSQEMTRCHISLEGVSWEAQLTTMDVRVVTGLWSWDALHKLLRYLRALC